MGESTAAKLVELMHAKAPEYLDLLTAETDEQFERAFDIILERAVRLLESNKKNFRNLDEEGLTATLALALSMPGFTVTQETNSNGHVDLTMRTDRRIRLAEAKVYNGPEYHFSGIEQLLTRYMMGREGRGLLISYVRKRDIAGLVKKLRLKMDEVRPCKQVER